MIQLDKGEKQWINLFKNRLNDKYPFEKDWITTIKPMFIELYGWSPDEDGNYYDYLECVFGRLLEIYLKIQYDESGSNRELKGIFSASFFKRPSNEHELPIERAIKHLCGLIGWNTVLVNEEKRYELD